MTDFDDNYAARNTDIAATKTILAKHVRAIYEELGSNPSGIHVDLMGRLTALDGTVAGKAAASHTHAAADIASGTIAPARLGTGTANSSKVLNGAGQWVDAPGTNIKVLGKFEAVPAGLPANALIFRLPS